MPKAKRSRSRGKTKAAKKTETPNKGKKLTVKQKKFVLAWFKYGGNQTRAALEAFDISNAELVDKPKELLTDEEKIKLQRARNVAMSTGASCMVKDNVTKEIARLMPKLGLNDDIVDREHQKIIRQDKNLNAKNKAIELYKREHGHLDPTVKHVHAFADISKMSDEELAREQANLEKFFNKE